MIVLPLQNSKCLFTFYILLSLLFQNKNIIKLIDKYEDLVAPRKPLNMECQEFKNSFNYVKINKKGCILNCTNSDNIFTKDQKATTQTLIIVGAFLCLGLCLTTLIIYIMNCCTGESHSAATFANRSPVFLVFSYVGLSLGYLISQFGILNNPGEYFLFLRWANNLS